jgi:hypothetical protein
MSTTTRTRRSCCATGMVALVTGVAAWLPAAAQDDLTVEVGECVELATPEERLACFEAQVEAARQQRSGPEGRRAAEPRAVPPAAEPQVEAARVPERNSAAEERAEPRERRTRREERGPRGGDPEQAEVVAKIAALRETVPNQYLITLDNGQVWRQTRPTAYALREGADVRLYSTQWGDSFRLTIPERGGYVQVERVR